MVYQLQPPISISSLTKLILLFCRITTAGEENVSVERKKTTTEKEINYKSEKLFNQVERGGWVVLLLFLLASFLGIFGSGPLSKAESTADKMSIQFNRFTHNLTPTELTVNTISDTNSIKISKEYLMSYKMEAIRPSPIRVTEEEDMLVFEFGNNAQNVTFQMTPEKAGIVTGEVMAGKDKAMVQQLIYP